LRKIHTHQWRIFFYLLAHRGVTELLLMIRDSIYCRGAQGRWG
jgi:hypothetical protein